jgi:hypothetical protein
MAVLNFHRGITAQVLIDGSPADEIPDDEEIQIDHSDSDVVEHQAARTVSSYIQAETGKAFSIRVGVKCPPYKMDSSKLCFHIFVDGKPAWISICDRPHFERRGNTEWEEDVDGIKEGKGQGCREYGFRFAKIETSTFPIPLSNSSAFGHRLSQYYLELRSIRTRYMGKSNLTTNR